MSDYIQDIDLILRDVQKEIVENGYVNDIPSFNYNMDLTTKQIQNKESVDVGKMRDSVMYLNEHRTLDPNKYLIRKKGIKGAIAFWIKKIVYQCMMPLIIEQNIINENILVFINQMDNYITEGSEQKTDVYK